MKPGLYRLTCDVENPCKDGRRNGWPYAPVIKEGKMFTIHADDDPDFRGRLEMRSFPLRPGFALTVNPKRPGRRFPLVALLLKHLRPASALVLDEVLAVRDATPREALQALLKARLVSLQTIEAALAGEA